MRRTTYSFTTGLICTAALAVYLGYPFSGALLHELKRVETAAIYQKRVFFIQGLGFITPTGARRISLEEARDFERLHEKTYRDLGFELVFVSPGHLSDRASAIKRAAASRCPHRGGVRRVVIMTLMIPAETFAGAADMVKREASRAPKATVGVSTSRNQGYVQTRSNTTP